MKKTLTSFQQKALNFEHHIALTANAGSGKTFVLAKRFVEIALRKNIQLNKLVAITFTEKAAGELYSKIAKEINEKLKIERDEKNVKILRRIRRQLVSANISTIHSFCSYLIREFAPVIGVDTNFRPIDERIPKELLDLIIEEYIDASIRNKKEKSTAELVRFFGSVKILKKEMRRLFAKRNTTLELAEYYRTKSEEELAESFRKKFETKFAEYFGDLLEQTVTELETLNSAVLAADEENGIAQKVDVLLRKFKNSKTLLARLTILQNIFGEVLTGEKTIRKRGYFDRVKKEFPEEQKDSLQKKIDKLKNIEFTDDPYPVELSLAKYGKYLLSLFHQIYDEYEIKKKSLGYLDFEALLLYASKILEMEEARKKLAERFEFIMVDEYQDTNEVQYKIIMPLLEKLNRGNLFVVGDDKQSIYMFREAELEIFRKTKNEIKTTDGDDAVIELPHSFRLAPNIAFFTNKVFSKVFAEPNSDFNEVAHSDLICARSEKDSGKIEIIVAEEKSEAENIATRIIKLVNESPLSYKDIAVLCKRREWFKPLSEAFSKAKIPFTIFGSKGFYQNQIVQDVYNFLSFLPDNRNDAALIALLRSPFFYFTDSSIFEINSLKGETFFEKLKLYSERHPRAKNVVEVLARFAKLSNEIPLNELIRKLLNETGYLAVISARENSELQVANLKKLISISNNFGNESFATFYDFVEFLGNSIKNYEDESEAELIQEEDKVQLMTIHKAKGLEFPAVFIYGANDVFKTQFGTEKEVVVDKEYGLMTKTPIGDDYFNSYRLAPIASLFFYYLKRKTLAEEKRLFYVAVTRAMDYLFISSSAFEGGGKITKNSFLEMLSSVFEKSEFKKGELNNEGTLEFISFDGGFEKRYERSISFKIPIITDVEFPSEALISKNKRNAKSKLLVQTIPDSPKNEIFSATRILTYAQCPLKYKLIYELGFAKLEKLLNGLEFEDKDNENTEQASEVPANVKGSIIHKILEKNISDEELSGFVADSLKCENNSNYFSNDEVEEIIEIVKHFRKSEVFLKINSFKNYRNEFPIYLRQKDYFLFGILDKIIFNDGEIIIADYKTDFVSDGEGKEKFEYYKNQLLFYALLVSKYFKPEKGIELNLVFVRKPEETIVQKLNSTDIEQYGKWVANIIGDIQSKRFFKNKNNCYSCHFFRNGKCVVPQN